MRKALEWLAILVGVVVFLAAVGLGVLFFAFPRGGPPPKLAIQATPELLQRGKYLAEHVAVCIDCHSTRDWKRFSGPPVAGTAGKGGEVFPEEMGFPGTLRAPNITPFALGDWTDGEIARAVTVGVNRAGAPLFPLMPYPYYRHLCARDVEAIVAFVRTLVPVEHTPPRSTLKLPVSLIVRTIPGKPAPEACPTEEVSAERGRYVAMIAGCVECHSPVERGQVIRGKEWIGGRAFPLPGGGTVRSQNLTPHQTGIGAWSEEQFVMRFKTYETADLPVEPGQFNTIMPWTMYAGMSREDLRSVYLYLRTLPAVANGVETFSAK
jgi:Cytochrome c